MTRQQLMKDFDEFMKTCRDELEKKNKEYSKEDNPFYNFIDCGEIAGVDMKKVWLIYAHKHYNAICTYIRENKTHSDENIDNRIMDMVNYLLFLHSMIQQEELTSMYAQVDEDLGVIK